jgi:CRISPR-associated endonuclease/helicase Cas3
MDADLKEERDQAKTRYIREPWDVDHLWELVRIAREEEAPELHPAHQALTRLAEPSVTAILLDVTEAGPTLRGEAVSLERTATTRQAAVLLERSVSLSDRRVVYALRKQAVPSGWCQSPLLRHCRPVLLGRDGWCDIGEHTLRLDPELGVVIE